jgi:hypothetical protein
VPSQRDELLGLSLDYIHSALESHARCWGAQVVECLPGKHKSLSSKRKEKKSHATFPKFLYKFTLPEPGRKDFIIFILHRNLPPSSPHHHPPIPHPLGSGHA